jgi:hypothetical protein
MGHLSIKPFGFTLALVACGAGAQNVNSAYNRDTHDQFKLKDISSKSVVKGPIVKQETVYDFENPYTKLTEASVWFDLDHATILSNFGYWYKDEYVPGVLMDKNKAWFIYTAITSRNEDPGIMVQTDESSYHTQIFPLAQGHDFRLKLTSVGFLEPEGNELAVPQPRYMDNPYPQDVISADPQTLVLDAKSSPPKTLVNYPQDPKMDMQVYAQRHKDGYTYIAGILRTDNPNAKLKLAGIHKVYWTRPQGAPDGSVKLFVGRRKGPGTIKIATKGAGSDYTKVKYIKANERGSDAAKIWAHQKLVQNEWEDNKDVLAFSLQYQVPSSETALLAVPQEQMKLFKKKAAEYRRHQAEEARRQRAWQNNRQSNWNSSSGGDPEIRVYQPDAERVYAILPDGRQFDLVKDSAGYWGGNYDIPADAPEGNYDIKVVSVDRSGQESNQTVSYQVDRTAPTGTLKMEDGYLVLTAEPGLSKVIAVFGDGTEEKMVEVTPGVYKIPAGAKRVVKVMLMDKAHNISELQWSN